MKTVLEYLSLSEISETDLEVNEKKSAVKKVDLNSNEKSELDELTIIILDLMRIIRLYNTGGINQKWCCINDLLQTKLSRKQKEDLINQVHNMGFSKIKEAFWILNQACESILCEPEDLFGIFKRHIFRHNDPHDDQEVIYFLGRYLNLTIIQFSRLKNRNGLSNATELKSVTPDVRLTLLPTLRRVSNYLESGITNEE